MAAVSRAKPSAAAGALLPCTAAPALGDDRNGETRVPATPVHGTELAYQPGLSGAPVASPTVSPGCVRGAHPCAPTIGGRSLAAGSTTRAWIALLAKTRARKQRPPTRKFTEAKNNCRKATPPSGGSQRGSRTLARSVLFRSECPPFHEARPPVPHNGRQSSRPNIVFSEA